MTRILNNGNAQLNSLVKESLDLKSTDRVLEIGFGPGKLLNKMASSTTEGFVEGIDFSQTMLKVAGTVNKKYISKGIVKLHKGECRNLPFDSQSFEKLCTVNTIYFWKNPDAYFKEMYRVIKPGGKVVVGFRDDKQMNNLNLRKDIFNTNSQNDVCVLLTKAGFSNAFIKARKDVPFVSYCAVAIKGE